MFELAYDRATIRKIISATTGLRLSQIPDNETALIPFEAINSQGEVRGCADLHTASIRLCYGKNAETFMEIFPASKGKRFDIIFCDVFLAGETQRSITSLIKLPVALKAFLEEAYATLH
jgi:hypothetical protein